jgi:acylglycerol lipase
MLRSRSLIVIASLACGCAHVPDPGLRAAAPPHPAVAGDVVRHDEPPLDGGGGVRLYAQSWHPQGGDARAVVVLQHGLKDEGDRYEAFAERLVRAGYAVYAMDLPGHGRSAGPRTSIDHFDHYVRDLIGFVDRVHAAEPGKPVFVFGHSMGGEIVARFAEERPDAAAGVILSAPALGLDAPALKAAFARMAGATMPGFPALALPERDFSRVPAVVASMKADPLIAHPTGPAHTAGELLAGIEAIWAHTDRVTMPILVVHGTADRLTSPAASRDFVARIPSADKRLLIYDGAWHVLLDDTVGDQVQRDLIGWLDAHAGGAAAGAPAPYVPVTRRLAGDRRLAYQALDLAARVDDLGGDTQTSGLVRVRLGAGHAALGPGQLGWGGGLDLRAGYDAGSHLGVDVLPVGLSYRTAAGALGLAGGIGFGGDRRFGAARGIAELWFDGAGPVPLVLRLRDEVGLNARAAGVSLTDSADPSVVAGLRLGRAHRYWGRTVAGAGPLLAATWSDALGWGVIVGLDAAGWQ